MTFGIPKRRTPPDAPPDHASADGKYLEWPPGSMDWAWYEPPELALLRSLIDVEHEHAPGCTTTAATIFKDADGARHPDICEWCRAVNETLVLHAMKVEFPELDLVRDLIDDNAPVRGFSS